MLCVAAVDRLSLAADAELGAEIRAAARRSGMSISAWLADAAADKLRNELLGRTLAEWVADHGAPTPEEEAEAAAFFDQLGVPRPASVPESA
jgi:hypothetical protein